MRFLIAAILITLYVFIALATSKGIEGVGNLMGYMTGTILAPAIIAALFCIPKTSRNNKRFFRVFNVVLFLTIIGQSGQLIKFIEQSSKPPQTIVGVKSQIEITVPGSWNIKEVPNESILLNLDNSSGYVSVIVNYEGIENNQINLEDYALAVGNNFKVSVPDFDSISEIKECVLTQMECVYQVVNTTTGEKGTTTIVASLSGKEGNYNFMATTNPGLLETYQNDIFNALKSVREIY